MALKTNNETITSDSACYQKDVHGPVLGIHFTLSDGTSLLALYPFLSHVQMKKEEEITFHYSFGIVRVQGRRLHEIFRWIQDHKLAAVKCGNSEALKSDEPLVREIVLEDVTQDENL